VAAVSNRHAKSNKILNSKFETKEKSHFFIVAGASCSRPSLERPAPSSEPPKHPLFLI
jgi:hypothetical protein